MDPPGRVEPPLRHREALPYPESMCHQCAAPPQYVRTRTSVFILCPLLSDKYPRQPVLSCPLFRPAARAPPESPPPVA